MQGPDGQGFDAARIGIENTPLLSEESSFECLFANSESRLHTSRLETSSSPA